VWSNRTAEIKGKEAQGVRLWETKITWAPKKEDPLSVGRKRGEGAPSFIASAVQKKAESWPSRSRMLVKDRRGSASRKRITLRGKQMRNSGKKLSAKRNVFESADHEDTRVQRDRNKIKEIHMGKRGHHYLLTFLGASGRGWRIK